MFDFVYHGVLGLEIECGGEKYLAVHYLKDDFYLAVKPDDKIPCNVYLVKKDKPV